MGQNKYLNEIEKARIVSLLGTAVIRYMLSLNYCKGATKLLRNIRNIHLMYENETAKECLRWLLDGNAHF